MEDRSPQGTKVPLIVGGVALLVIAVGIMVRSGNAPAPEPSPTAGPAPSAAAAQQFTGSLLTAQDASGAKWMLSVKMGPSQTADEAKPGAPISVKADVQGQGPSKTIGLLIEGAAGEIYQPTVVKNGAILPAPTFTVLDESGAAIGAGAFEYG